MVPANAGVNSKKPSATNATTTTVAETMRGAHVQTTNTKSFPANAGEIQDAWFQQMLVT